jgi:WhiB family redox-sensing transcriptional regulator
VELRDVVVPTWQGELLLEQGWELQARCRSEDPRLFFGPNRFEPKHERLEREAQAKAVCSTCPVVAACREHALASGELYGVWGGLGEADLRTLLADRGRVARAG